MNKNCLRTKGTQEILSGLAVERTQLCEKLVYSNITSKFSGVLGDKYIIKKNNYIISVSIILLLTQTSLAHQQNSEICIIKAKFSFL